MGIVDVQYRRAAAIGAFQVIKDGSVVPFSHLHIESHPAEILVFSPSHKAKHQPLQTSRDLDAAGPLRLLD